jgi:acyl-CoA dehydrogenase
MFSWVVRGARAAGLVPRMSDTEREALEAGDVFLEGDLFRGRPDFARLLGEAWPRLTAEEQAFLEGPVETVCGMVDDWALQRTRRPSPEVMDFLKREGFFGLVIPK